MSVATQETVHEAVRVELRGPVAIIIIDNPPVNAFSHHVRVPLSQALATLDADSSVRAIVIGFAGKTFSVGADVRELGAAPIPPSMGDVLRQLDTVAPVLIAAIHGQALGGGLELALACDYRVATADAKFGLPEIRLGLMPGGGGTQRLPRLIGIEPALDMILTAKTIGAGAALASGLIDKIAEGELIDSAVDFAGHYFEAAAAKRRLSETDVVDTGVDFAKLRRDALKASKGLSAAGAAVDAVQAATTLPFAEGIKREADLFQQCRVSTESAALRYLFAGEREVGRIPGQAVAPPRQVERVAIIGAGTMGAGVAVSFLDAGYPLTLIETTQAALDRGTGNIAKTYDGLVGRGRLSATQRDQRLAQLRPSLALLDTANADLVIECVFEDLQVKQELMARLGPLLGRTAILATNTSALDVNALAAASGRPADVVGMHFFSPANIMKLVEVVNGAATAPDVLATAMAVAKKIGKIGVVSGVCDGFIGNRMIGGYLKQANLLLFEGALPEQIDAALQKFGMAMGPHAMGDMAGLDIQAAGRRRRLAEGSLSPDEYYGAIADRLVAHGRFGLKAGKGVYRYEAGARTPLPDPETVSICQEEAARRGIAPRKFTDDEIIARCVLPLINEGAKILAEGIAFGPVDIDVLYCAGYGFPRARGGPMFYADTLELDNVVQQMRKLAEIHGPRYWTPSNFLVKLANERKSFISLKR